MKPILIPIEKLRCDWGVNLELHYFKTDLVIHVDEVDYETTRKGERKRLVISQKAWQRSLRNHDILNDTFGKTSDKQPMKWLFRNSIVSPVLVDLLSPFDLSLSSLFDLFLILIGFVLLLPEGIIIVIIIDVSLHNYRHHHRLPIEIVPINVRYRCPGRPCHFNRLDVDVDVQIRRYWSRLDWYLYPGYRDDFDRLNINLQPFRATSTDLRASSTADQWKLRAPSRQYVRQYPDRDIVIGWLFFLASCYWMIPPEFHLSGFEVLD